MTRLGARTWRGWAILGALAGMVVIATGPTALDATESVVGSVDSSTTFASAVPRVRLPIVSTRTLRSVGRSTARLPLTKWKRVASGGQVRRTARTEVRLSFVTVLVAGVLAIRRRRRLKDPVPPRQRGPDGSRAPPRTSSLRRATASELVLGRIGGRSQGGFRCPSSNIT